MSRGCAGVATRLTASADRMVEDHGGRCGLCGDVPEEFVVDHCHASAVMAAYSGATALVPPMTNDGPSRSTW
jgi:hypothetical protein